MAQQNVQNENNKKNICPQKNCPIFADVKLRYHFSLEALYHLGQYTHLDRVPCRYGKACKAFKRLREGGYRLDDRCHVAVYIHGARIRDKDIIPPKWNTFGLHGYGHGPTCPKKNKFRKQMEIDRSTLKLSPNDRCVEDECDKNGLKRALYPTSGPYKHLREVVAEKMKHPRCPKGICYDEMLSVLLYTGTDVYSDLIAANRKGDYSKWKYTYASLRSALFKLPSHPGTLGPLYRGLHKVYFPNDIQSVCCFQFDTFVSFSWDKTVANDFCGGEGMIFELTGFMGNDCLGSDVSWISKFPNECEILLSLGPQSSNGRQTCFKVEWSDDKKIQTAQITSDVG
eukprot:127676_1